MSCRGKLVTAVMLVPIALAVVIVVLTNRRRS